MEAKIFQTRAHTHTHAVRGDRRKPVMTGSLRERREGERERGGGGERE